jgi:hypothetical protein
MVLLLILMQLVVSARAGLVTSVHGKASVAVNEQIAQGKLIETGPRSHIEMVLSPSSILRLDQNSSIVLDSVDLSRIVVRIVSGEAMIAARNASAAAPIRVISGELRALIREKGIYRFSMNGAVVVDGKLVMEDSALTVGGGKIVNVSGGEYRQTAVPPKPGSTVNKFIGEPKAGFVNAIEGEVNVTLHQQIRVGEIVKTGPGGLVELLLGPNEYLRLGENSELIFDSVALSRSVYRLSGSIDSGAVLVPQRVRPAFRISGTGIVESGSRISRFYNNLEFIRSRSINIEGRAGWIGFLAGSRETRLFEIDALDLWSEQRSYELARVTQLALYPGTPKQSGWIFSPDLNGLTMLPDAPTISPYGYTSVPLFPSSASPRGTRGGRGAQGQRGGRGSRGGP